MILRTEGQGNHIRKRESIMALRSSCFPKPVVGIADACGEIQYQQLARKWSTILFPKTKKEKTKTRRSVAHIYLN